VNERRVSGEAAPESGGQVLIFPDAGLAALADSALVRLLVEGDVRAPRLVWQRFAPMVHRMLKRAFGPEYDIADLVQEVFLVLFRRAHTMREPQALSAFIIAITAHTIRYELRRKTAVSWLRFGEPAIAKAADADLHAREAVKRLYRILDHLSAQDRVAFVLRFIDGMEIADLARALGVSPATTKRRVAHAWKRVVVHAQRDSALVGYLAGLRPGGIE
jgi:RNA polymerase sigma-70 factor (ECF subfamily)